MDKNGITKPFSAESFLYSTAKKNNIAATKMKLKQNFYQFF